MMIILIVPSPPIVNASLMFIVCTTVHICVSFPPTHTVMTVHTLFLHALLVDCPIGGCTWLCVGINITLSTYCNSCTFHLL